MIKIDDKELRNPVEQIKKNMDDIAELQGNIKAQTVYSYKGLIGGTSVTQVNRSSTNVPEGINEGWLVDYTGKLFRITGGNTTTLLIDYYASIKGPTGPAGADSTVPGPKGDPGVGIVSIIKTSTVGLVDTYTITYTNGQQSTFTVTNGEKGDPGVPGPTYNAGDNIQINNSTKIISANENIIPKTNYGYDLGSSTKLYKNVYAGGLKNTYFNILTGGVNGHGTAILSTTNAQGTTEGSLRLDYNKIQVNQKLVPSSNNTLDLGTSYSKFDKIYVNTLSDGTNTIDVADIGTGSEYTAGDGIDITNDVISVDTDTVALKSDIPDVSDFVTTTALSTTLDDYELKADAFSGDYTDLTNKPTIPTVEANSASTPTATLNNINIDGTVYSIPQGGGSGNSSSGIYLSSADLDTTVNYNKIILISTINLGSNTLAVDDIIIGANKYVGVVTTIGVNPNNQPVAAVKTLGDITDPDLSNYITSTDLTTALADYELKSEAFSGDYDDLTDKPDLSIYAESANLATVATSGSYNDLSNKPTIPNVYNPTITIQKNGTTVDTFRLNQSTAKTINITVPTVTSDLTNDSGYITNSALTPYVNEVVVNGDTYTPVNNVVDLGYVTPQGSTLTSGKVYRHRIMINTSNAMNTNYIIGEYLTGDSTAYFNGTTVTGSGLANYFSGVQAAIDNRSTYYFGNKFYYNNKEYNDITNRFNTDSSIIYMSPWGIDGVMRFPKTPTLSTTTTTISSQTVVKSASLGIYNSLEFATGNTYYLFDSVEEYVEFGLVEPANTVKSIEVNGTTYTPTNNVVTLPNYPTLPTLATVATTGDYDDLTNKPTIPTVPITSISVNNIAQTPVQGNVDLTMNFAERIDVNGSSYTATNGVITLPNYPTLPTLATVATTGDYDDLINKPTFPSDIVVIEVSDSVESGTLTASEYTQLSTYPTKTIIKRGNFYYKLNLDTDSYFRLECCDGGYNTIHNNNITVQKDNYAWGYSTSLANYTIVDENLIPNQNNYYSLGSNSYKYENLYLAGNLTDGTNSVAIANIAKTNDLATVATSGDYDDLTNKPNIPDEVTANTASTPTTTLTNLQVGSTVYSVPDVPGMVGEVLYSNASGSTDLTLTMAHSFADYSYVDIQWINNDNITNSTRVYEPNGKRISVINMFGFNPGTPEYINKAGIFDLSGTSMTQVCKIQGTIRNNSNSGVDYKSDSTVDGLINITKVVGYKQNSSPIVIPIVEANTASTPTATLTNLQVGSIVYEIPSGGSGAVNDVQVNGTSVVDSDGIANISLPHRYQHNITLKGGTNVYIYLQVINSSNTAFTIANLWTWLKNNGFQYNGTAGATRAYLCGGRSGSNEPGGIQASTTSPKMYLISSYPAEATFSTIDDKVLTIY